MCNFRDLGGLLRTDGTRLPAGWLFRSDAPSADSDADLDRIRALGIRTIVDLRSAQEQPSCPPVLRSTCAYVSIPIDRVEWADSTLASEDMADFLAGRYLRLAAQCLTDDDRRLGSVLNVLGLPCDQPRIVWCAGGKDRTGLVTAILLRLLGVTDDDIRADYARSSSATAELRRRARAETPAKAGRAVSPEDRRAALRGRLASFSEGIGRLSNPAPPEAIGLFLASLSARHGGVESYAASVGADMETIAMTRRWLSALAVTP
ncbi:tyrosine-protein phosphatase [Streptomyces sp. NPDC051554]|uniref:tyrosine-protein phosphatase n=1 Tax=Streptomyces sp. NPDC051554 TaxID=3365656 RepID=UPI0037A47943